MKKGDLLDKAIVIATNAHHGQLDKGGSPISYFQGSLPRTQELSGGGENIV